MTKTELVLKYIKANPWSSRTEICEGVDMSQPFLNGCIQRLNASGYGFDYKTKVNGKHLTYLYNYNPNHSETICVDEPMKRSISKGDYYKKMSTATGRAVEFLDFLIERDYVSFDELDQLGFEWRHLVRNCERQGWIIHKMGPLAERRVKLIGFNKNKKNSIKHLYKPTRIDKILNGVFNIDCEDSQ